MSLAYLLLTSEQIMRICSQYLSCIAKSEVNNTSIATATPYSPLSNNKLLSFVVSLLNLLVSGLSVLTFSSLHQGTTTNYTQPASSEETASSMNLLTHQTP